MILVFILFSFFHSRFTNYNPAAVTGVLIAGMAPDLSYDNTRRSGWIFREWNENKISRQYILLK